MSGPVPLPPPGPTPAPSAPYTPNWRADSLFPAMPGQEVQRNHAIPAEFKGHPVLEALYNEDVRHIWNPDSGQLNGNILPNTIHNGSHPRYSALPRAFLNGLLNSQDFLDLQNPNVTPEAAHAARVSLATRVYEEVKTLSALSSDQIMSDLDPNGNVRQGGLNRLLYNRSDIGLKLSADYDVAHAATLSGSALEAYENGVIDVHNARVDSGVGRTAEQWERFHVGRALGPSTLTDAARNLGLRAEIDAIRASARAANVTIGEGFALSQLSDEALATAVRETPKHALLSMVRVAVDNPRVFGRIALTALARRLAPVAGQLQNIADVADFTLFMVENRAEIGRTFADVAGFYTRLYRQVTSSGGDPRWFTPDTEYFMIGDPVVGTVQSLRPGLAVAFGDDPVLYHLVTDVRGGDIGRAVESLGEAGYIKQYSIDWAGIEALIGPQLKQVRDAAAPIYEALIWNDTYADVSPNGLRSLNPRGGDLFGRFFNQGRPALLAEIERERQAELNQEIVITAQRPRSKVEVIETENVDGKTTEVRVNLDVTRLPEKARTPLGDAIGTGLKDGDVLEIVQTSTTGPDGEVETSGPQFRLVRLGNANREIDGAAIAQLFGSNLAHLLGIDNSIAARLVSATVGELARNLFDEVDDIFGGEASVGFEDFGADLGGAAIGAVSSILSAELISAIGLDGLAGEVANIVTSSVIGNIAGNIIGGATGAAVLDGIVNLSQLGSAFGGFVGATLASEIVEFNTLGGQIGSALGSAVGGYAVGALFAESFKFLGFAAGPIGAVIGAFVGFLVGGLIGSIFGGTPRSGADTVWDEAKGQFAVANAYSKKGGSKEAAISVASAVAESLNGIVAAIGGNLVDPTAIQTGNYGMRKKDFVYRPYSTREKDAITARFRGQDAAAQITNFGIYTALTDPDFKLVGGDVFVKRAFAGAIALAQASGRTGGDFSLTSLLGDLTAARDYGFYFQNSQVIQGMISLLPDNAFSIGWAATIARGLELGLNRRAASDWDGGYNAWLDHLADGELNGFSLSINRVVAQIEPENGERYWTVLKTDGSIAGYLHDTINAADLTRIDGTAGNDAIAPATSAIAVAATIDAGEGDDTVHASDRGDNVFGGAGSDTLYGGRLDDWLLGGDGNDILQAGSQAGGLGGDGNYLHGGAGGDQLYGREGSDWLEGGEGTDVLTGGAGGDILAGGAGDGDVMKGGAGDDHYLVRVGDGADTAEDEAGAPAATPGLDPLRVRLAGLAAGTIARDWIGDGDWRPRQPVPPSGSTTINAGEDRLVLGAGIRLENVRLSRGGELAGTTEDDLVLELTDAPGVPTGDRLLMKGWYNSYKRIEWLEFSDGQAIRIGDFSTFIAGSAGNDHIIGTQGRDFAVGGLGDDWLELLGGDDVGVGGAGKDWVSGDGNNDLLVGGDDDDRVLGGWGDDTLSGDGGADELEGGLGRDVLAGGRGDDLVTGGAGDDIFRVSRGDGRDTIIDTTAGTWEAIMAWNTAEGRIDYVNGFTRDANNQVVRGEEMVFDGTDWTVRVQFDGAQLTHYVADPAGRLGRDATESWETGDAFEFGLGINIQDLMLAQYGYDLYVGISQENANVDAFSSLTDHVRLADWYVDGNRPIERFVFAATGELNTETTNLIGGTDGADTIDGTTGADWITGNGGDDTLRGSEGKDILNGNAGSDLVQGGLGDDIVYGGAGNDVLDGGKGADILIGGDGNDTASYASASAGVAAYLDAGGRANAGNYSIIPGSDAIGDVYHDIENLTGSSLNDYALGGDDGDNVLGGGAGNDNLFGGAGDDTYVWNIDDLGDTINDRPFATEVAVTADGKLAEGYNVSVWADTGVPQSENPSRTYWRLQITGPGGEPVYDYDKFTTPAPNPNIPPAPAAFVQLGWKNGFGRVLNGAGNQQLVVRQHFDDQANGGEVDTLEMGEGVTLTDLTFEQNGTDLLIRYQGNAYNFVRIKNQTNANAAVEWLQLHDGLAVSLANLQFVSGDILLTGTAEADFLVGRDNAAAIDQITGGDGDDVIAGLAGNDVLSGGAGDDTIEGGAGADAIDGGANNAAVDGDMAGDTVRYVGSAAVTIDLRNSATGQSGGDAQGDVLTGIENVVGSRTGNDSIIGNDGDNLLIGLGGNDVLDGLAGDDVLLGDAGDDLAYGGDGDDNIAGGEGADQLWGGAGVDTIDGAAGNDILKGEAGKDALIGGGGNDDLDGGGDDDDLVGGAGDDILKGGDGNDQLSGELGNDRLEGGLGDDVYTFSATSGEDLVVDAAGLNDLVFDASVDHRRIWLARIYGTDDLKISIIGAPATITVQDFFAASNAGLVRTLQTTSHVLYLGHPDTLNFIADMASASSSTPTSMPQAILDELATYWHADGKAAPTASAIDLATNEDTLVGPISAGVIDHDENIASYVIKTQGAHGIAAIDLQTGQFTYTPTANFHGEDQFIVLATDADGQAVEIEVGVTVSPVNDAPVGLVVEDGQTLAIDEFAPGSATQNGAVVGRFLASDVDGDTLTYTLTENAGGAFFVTSSGQLGVNEAALLDHEGAASRLIRVRVSDGHGGALEQEFTVQIGDVNEAPDAPTIVESRGSVGESISSSSADRWIAGFSLTDTDGTVPTLEVVNDPEGRFQIVGNELRFAHGYEPDFEALYAAGLGAGDSDGDGLAEAIVTAQVRANDGSLSSPIASGSIRIEDVNEAPTALNISSIRTSVDERDRVASDSPEAAIPAIDIGTFQVDDPDLPGFAHSTYSYSVSDDRFEMVGNLLRLKAGARLDHEAETSVTMTVMAVDQMVMHSIQKTITIGVNDVMDVLEGSSDRDILAGQANEDRIVGFAGDDDLFGGDGADELVGSGGNDALVGGDGPDSLDGGAGFDIAEYYYVAPNEVATSGVIADLLAPEGNSGAAAGDQYADVEYLGGTDYYDTLRGGNDNSLLLGRGADDILVGRDGDDYLRGGAGADQLYGDAGDDQLFGDDGDDFISGGEGIDLIEGSAGNDVLEGGDGDDHLYGGDGADTLRAQGGNDWLYGDAGNDTLIGGEGNDTYIITRTSGADTIDNYDLTTATDYIGFQNIDGPIDYDDIWFEQAGNDLRISIVGTNTIVTILNWFAEVDAASRSDYRVDFFATEDHWFKSIDIGSLLTLMAGRTKPTSETERYLVMQDNAFREAWATYWNVNEAPVLAPITDQSLDEDGFVTVTLTASDDFTLPEGLRIEANEISGNGLLEAMLPGTPSAAGQYALTVRAKPNASGTTAIRVVAYDAGGRPSIERVFNVTVRPIVDQPTIDLFTGGVGMTGQAGGIALALNVDFPDPDGEIHEVWISGVPSGVTLNLGSRDSSTGIWKLSAPTPAQLATLKVTVPSGWSQDFILTATAFATEGGQTVSSTSSTAKLVVHAPPSGLTLRGLNTASTPSVNEYTPTSNPAGARIGVVVPIDPDAADNNLIGQNYPNLASLPQLSPSEQRIVNAVGPQGTTVEVMETGQDGTVGHYHGGGVPWASVGTADTSKAYKFTIYFKPENNMGHSLYFGTYGNIENASNGAANTNPYFWSGNSSGLIQDRWYRIEGYVLPSGSALIGNDSFGGVFDTVTGQKVANTVTYRFGAGGSETGARFFSYYGEGTAGYSAQWYQPTVEELDYIYELRDDADGRFAINPITGLITAVGTNFNYETQTAHNVTVRVTDGYGLYKDQVISIGVNNVNEVPTDIWADRTLSFNENIGAGTGLAWFGGADPESNIASYSLVNNAGGRFALDANGLLKVGTTGLNYEAGSSQTIVVRATDAGGLTYDESFTVTIGNVNEAPTDIWADRTLSFNENIGVGTGLAWFGGADPEGNITSYSLLNSAGNRFALRSDGLLMVGSAGLNFEAGASQSILVRATDAGGLVRDEWFTVTIGNLNETPNAPSGVSAAYFDETGLGSNPANAHVVAGSFALSDPDGTTPSLQFASGGNPNNWFYISGNTVRFNPGLDFNFEWARNAGYAIADRDGDGRLEAHVATIAVQASDGQLASGISYQNIFIEDVNRAPTIGNQVFPVSERGPSPVAAVAELAWTDLDGKPANGHRFQIIGGNPSNLFSIDNTGKIYANGLLNYEDVANRNFTLRVQVTDEDGSGLSAAADVSINVTNVNEAPRPTMADTSIQFMGRATVGGSLGMMPHHDPDIGEVVSYQVMSVDNWDLGYGQPTSRYLVTSAGQVKINYNGTPSWRNTDEVRVRAYDDEGLSGYITFTVTYNMNKPNPPVIFDLDGDGLELVSKPVSDVHVDMDGDGVLDRTGWVAADDGFLALDRNGDGIVTDMSETSFVSDVPGAVSDLEGLRAFDTDADGFLDTDDEAFGSFMVWQDLNQDGVSQTGELRSLAQAGIAFVNLMLNPTGQSPGNLSDNVIYATGEYGRTDGTLGQIGDVMLAYEPSDVQMAPPIILDLDGNGVTTSEYGSDPVQFDMDGDGKLDRTGWVSGADGLLALDRNGDGVINDIAEISFIDDLEGARTDLEGLAAFDSNRDGILSAVDTKFGEFRVWVDADHDGVSDSGELKRLAEVGVVSIDLEGEATGAPSVAGRNVIYNLTSFLRGDGSEGIVGDVGLTFVSSATGVSDTTGTNQVESDHYSFAGRRSKYRIETRDGGIFVPLKKTRGIVDAGAGAISASSEILFTNGLYGLSAAVVLDLDGDGLELRKRKSADLAFDMNADGVADDTGWVNRNDGLLVLDRNANGRIDSTGEFSFLGDRVGARSGLEGLAAFDTNRDGLFDAKDELFGDFQIWQDRNQDGISSAGELSSLATLGIESIELGRRPIEARWSHGQNIVLSTATFTRADGGRGTVGDVALAYKPSEAADPADRRLQALRMGLDHWRDLGRTEEGIVPFALREWPELPFSNPDGVDGAPTALSATGDLADNPFDARLAYLVQQMASFGARSGEGELRDRFATPARFDYYAS